MKKILLLLFISFIASYAVSTTTGSDISLEQELATQKARTFYNTDKICIIARTALIQNVCINGFQFVILNYKDGRPNNYVETWGRNPNIQIIQVFDGQILNPSLYPARCECKKDQPRPD